MTWLAAALALLPQLLFPILALSPLLRRVTRRGQVRVARVLTELLEELGHPLLQLRDASVLLGKNRVLRRQLGLELRDPIVSPVALHECPSAGRHGAARARFAPRRRSPPLAQA